jgi:hypothetical protein
MPPYAGIPPPRQSWQVLKPDRAAAREQNKNISNINIVGGFDQTIQNSYQIYNKFDPDWLKTPFTPKPSKKQQKRFNKRLGLLKVLGVLEGIRTTVYVCLL